MQTALAQIERMQYETSLLARGISAEHIKKYGLAFRGKEVLIKSGLLMEEYSGVIGDLAWAEGYGRIDNSDRAEDSARIGNSNKAAKLRWQQEDGKDDTTGRADTGDAERTVAMVRF